MPPKAILILAIASQLQDIQDINIENVSSNADNMWVREMLQQLIINQNAFKVKLNGYNYQPVKMPSIKWFIKDRFKLKGFFMQVKIQIDNEGPKLPTLFKKKIVYTKMYLIRKPLK